MSIRRLVALIAVPICALIAGAAFLMLRDSSQPSNPFPVQLRSFDKDYQSYAHDVRDRTAKIRGLKPDASINEGYVVEGDLAVLADSILTNRQPARLQQMRDALELLHLAKANVVERLANSRDLTGFAGIYFPEYEDGVLVLVGEPDKTNLSQEAVLSHEYTHSFQDKAFDLNAFIAKVGDPGGDYTMTVRCVLEGDAELTAFKYMKETYPDGWSRQAVGVSSRPSDSNAGEFSLGLAMYSAFPYAICPAFVSDVFDERGWEGVNNLYLDVPVSTEQIMHADEYLAGELPDTLRPVELALGPDWAAQKPLPFGELDVLAYLLALNEADLPGAYQAASGWGAGWLTTYTRKAAGQSGATLVHISLAWDSEADLTEFQGQYTKALKSIGLPDVQASVQTTDSMWWWNGEHEFGRALWTRAERRVDILISTDRPSVEDALPLMGVTGSQRALLGNVAFARQDWEEAFRYYAEALALDPTLHRVYFARAMIYARMENWVRAVEETSRALELEPGDSQYWWRRSEWRYQFREFEGAVSDATKALAIWTQQRNTSATGLAYLSRGLAEAELGRAGRAVQDLRLAVQTLTDQVRLQTARDKLSQLGAE